MSTLDRILEHIEPDVRHARQIKELQDQLDTVTGPSAEVAALKAQVELLQLLCRGLVELLTNKSVITEAEVSVVMQQIDLLDGVEDGTISEGVHERAPRCGHCGRYVNPKREACVYCGTAITPEVAAQASPRTQRMVDCALCSESVLESSSYYSGHGVVCSPCFARLDE